MLPDELRETNNQRFWSSELAVLTLCTPSHYLF